jgi:Leucine-rich repeat (LRR) protein
VKGLRDDSRNARITSLEGQHVEELSNDDVQCLRIERIATIEYFTNDFFVKFPHIQSLGIHDAPLRFLLRGDFITADNLVNIHITHTNLTELESSVFRGATVLKQLNLRDNQIRVVDKDAFDGLSNLRFLTLSFNRIESLHVDTFKKLGYLEQLSVGWNRIRHIDEHLLSKNVNLQVVFFDHNEISVLRGGMFDRNEKLREIYLDNNHIKHISNVPHFLTNLKELQIAVFVNNTCVDAMFLVSNSFYPPYSAMLANCQSRQRQLLV